MFKINRNGNEKHLPSYFYTFLEYISAFYQVLFAASAVLNAVYLLHRERLSPRGSYSSSSGVAKSLQQHDFLKKGGERQSGAEVCFLIVGLMCVTVSAECAVSLCVP